MDNKHPPPNERSDYIALGRLIRERRIANGKSQAEVARDVTCDQTDISKLENGVVTIGVIRFLAIAKAIETCPLAMLETLRAPEDET